MPHVFIASGDRDFMAGNMGGLFFSSCESIQRESIQYPIPAAGNNLPRCDTPAAYKCTSMRSLDLMAHEKNNLFV